MEIIYTKGTKDCLVEWCEYIEQINEA